MPVEDWQSGGFGLYIHWPYCQSKCPYCDFNSHVAAKIDESRWNRAYSAEIARVAEQTPNRVLNSIYFGGGTPSLMSADLVASIIQTARDHWVFANDIEITLEANPSSVEAARFQAYRDIGVGRVSIGVQALNDRDLTQLGRLHTAAQARAAIDTALSVFDRVSFDLIYARQNQSMTDWQNELTTALSLGTDHLSLYQLTIEPGTAFGDRFKRGRLPGLPDEDLSADLYFLTQDQCDAAGLPAYEVSNHARHGHQSRHNRVYWTSGDYAGIGPGAHGRLTLSGQRMATETHLAPQRWLQAVEDHGTGESQQSTLSRKERATEFLMMGLRLDDGIDLNRYREIAGAPLPPTGDLQDLGFVTRSDNILRVTRTGRPVLNAILYNLIPD